MKQAWRRVGLIIGIVGVVVCPIAGTVIADDGSDYRRALSDIESRLEAAKSYLADVRREQTDRAQDKINGALEKIAEVMRLADDARRKDVGNDDKRKADYHYEAARDFPESARALAQMKRVEAATKDAAWVTQCNELNGKLRGFADQLVNDKDHEGGTKLRSFAENQARPVREKLNANRSQDGYLSSWRSTAQRFNQDRDRWRDVKDNLSGAAQDSYEGWKRLSEEADRACEPVIKWEDNSVVRGALSALTDKAKSKGEYLAEIARQLAEAVRSLDAVERDSNESDILAAIRAGERIEDQLSRLRDVQGTDPRARQMSDKWPDIARRFKDAGKALSELKLHQFDVDRAQTTCQELEKETLSRVKSLLDSDPFDQNRMALRRKAESMAQDAGRIIADKLERAARLESDLRQLQDKASGFRADDADWQPVVKAVGAAASAMLEYYKGALRDANRACRDLALGDKHPAIKEIISGDCQASQLDTMHNAQVEWCSGKGSRSCKDLSRRDQCDDAKARLNVNEQCLARRRDIMSGCFRGGDAAHRRAVQDVEAVREVCMDRVKALCGN